MGAWSGVRWVLALVVAGQVALVGLTWWTRSWLLLALGELALLALAGGLVAVARYLVLRVRFVRERQDAARAAERRAVADDVHDLVGHELGLIAMEAGLLQLRADGETADLAARLRARAHHAVEALHDSVTLLDTEPAGPGPRSADPAALVSTAVSTGARVRLDGDLDGCPGPVRVVASRVVREGLTNAARHAPGRAVEVVVRATASRATVQVTTRDATPAGGAPGRGLAALRRRVEAIGGALAVTHGTDHVLTADLPLRPARTAVRQPGPSRRAVVVLARQAVLPVAATAVVLVGFYTWASTGATVEPGPVGRLAVGMPAERAAAVLPDRQAPVRLARAPRPPAGSTCRSFTDGNFPLAVATLQVCSDGTAVTRVTDLAARPLR